MCTIEWTALKIFSIFLKKTKFSESHLGTDQGAHLPICIFADESWNDCLKPCGYHQMDKLKACFQRRN